MAENLVVISKVKEEVSKAALNCAGDLAEKLNEKVADLIKEGAERAKAEGKKTLMARHL